MRKIVRWNSWNNIMFFIKIFSLLSIYKRKKKYEKSIKRKQTKSNKIVFIIGSTFTH